MPNNPIDKGLAAAFGGDEAEPQETSVIQKLQARARSKLGVHVDSPGPDDAPVKVTDEVKKLRDPAGRYQLLGEIGRGGVGTVYKGRDHDLGRDVAMKVLKDEFANRPDVLARFVEEAQIGGQLQHPGIVPVYELGLQAGERPYFAMKLVKGETLAAQLARRCDPTAERRRLLGIFEQICQTMAYAHARRVVHRDLKPANVMIGAFGEVQVVDWGFAKVLPKGGIADEAELAARDKQRSVIETIRSRPGSGSHSVAGSMYGTPSYMSPEQAIGDIERIDAHSDVFALGAILCEILTGEPPYRDVDGDLVHQAANAELGGAHERLTRSGADDALVALCTECMSPARRVRPNSAGEVAERIGEYLTSVEERARRAELSAAEARYKHRTTLVSAAAALVVLGLGAAAWIWIEHDSQRQRAEATQRVATASNGASASFGRAQSAGLDLTLWETALADARQLVTLATNEDVDAGTRREARELLARVQEGNDGAHAKAARQRRDAAMLVRLRELRVPTDEDVRTAGWLWREQQRLDTAYAEAFAIYLGKPLFEVPIEEALMSLRRGDIKVELATSLDHWGLARDGQQDEGKPADASDTSRIRELAMLLDSGDSHRSQLRALLPNAKGERNRLLALAESADLKALTGAGCRVLSDALWRAEAKDRAVEVLILAREIHPRDFDVCFQLGVCFEMLARWAEAAAAHTIANALRPEHDEVRHRQGLALVQLGRHVEAERVWRALHARKKKDAHWLRHLGQAQAAQNRKQQAAETYRRAMALEDPRANEVFNLGVAWRDLGKLEEARRCFERAIHLDSRYGEAHNSLGKVFSAQGQFEEAIQSFKRAIALAPRNPAPYTNFGEALRRQGKAKDALKWHQLAIDRAKSKVKRNNAIHYHQQGKTYEVLRRWSDAEASFRKAIELDPDSVILHCNLANMFRLQGKPEKAARCYQDAIGVDPNVAWVHLLFGNLRRSQRKPEEAMACYRRAVQVDPKYAPGYYGIAALYFNRAMKGERGMLDKTFEFLGRTLEVQPEHPQAHDLMGRVWRMRGEGKKAVLSHQKSIGYRPQSAHAHYNLGQALRDLKKTDAAIASFQKATEIQPRYADAHFWLGFERMQAGQLQRAVKGFESAIRIDPKRTEAYNHLGQALSKLNRPGKAIDCFRRGIRAVPWEQAGPLHINLGSVLISRGDLAAAIKAFKAAERSFAAEDSDFARKWRKIASTYARSAALVDEVVVSPQRLATSATEWSTAVRAALDQRFYREIVALTEKTLRDKPELTGGESPGLYNAARAAALLAANTTAKLSKDRRSGLRELARTWLAREIELWQKWVRDKGKLAKEGRSRLAYALQDPNFHSLRGDTLRKLPESERRAWQDLWRRIGKNTAK